MVTHTAVIPVSERAGIEQKRSPLLLILRLHIRVVFLWRSYSTLLPQAQKPVPLVPALQGNHLNRGWLHRVMGVSPPAGSLSAALIA